VNNKQVAEIFIEQNVLQPSQADDVLNEATLNGKTIAQAMVDGGFVDECAFYQTIADALGTEYVDLKDEEIPPAVLKLIPSGLARLHRALPIGLSGKTLRVALVDPLDPRAAEDLRFALGKDVDVVVAPTERIEERIKEYYGTDTSSVEDVLKQLGDAGELLQIRGEDGAVAAEAEANATPIIRFVDLILYQAIQDRASDIHFEPFENEFKIRSGRKTIFAQLPSERLVSEGKPHILKNRRSALSRKKRTLNTVFLPSFAKCLEGRQRPWTPGAKTRLSRTQTAGS
jgi:type IV pilus assembly protein PilB